MSAPWEHGSVYLHPQGSKQRLPEWMGESIPSPRCSGRAQAWTGLSCSPSGLLSQTSAPSGPTQLNPLFLLHFSAPSARRNFIARGSCLPLTDHLFFQIYYLCLHRMPWVLQAWGFSGSKARLWNPEAFFLPPLKLSSSVSFKSLFCKTEVKAWFLLLHFAMSSLL